MKHRTKKDRESGDFSHFRFSQYLCQVSLVLGFYSWSSRNFSALMAAIQPVPAAEIAWR